MSRQRKLQEMHQVLLERREALRQAIAGDDSLLRKFSQQTSGDVADFAFDSEASELTSQLAEFGARELQQVEKAIQRGQAGTYGKCDACSKNIPLSRLQALPYTNLCIGCQRAAEEAGVDPQQVVDWSQVLDGGFSSSDMDFHFS